MYHAIKENAINIYDYELGVLRSLSKSQLSRASRLAVLKGWALDEKNYGEFLYLGNEIVQHRFGLVRSSPAGYLAHVLAFIVNGQKYKHYTKDLTMLDAFLESTRIYLNSYTEEEGGVDNEK